MKEIIDRACDVECVTESDAKAVAALADLAVQLQSRLESLEQEMQEQARIIGMGAERELALIAKVESLEKENSELKSDVKIKYWQRNGIGCTAMQANKGS